MTAMLAPSLLHLDPANGQPTQAKPLQYLGKPSLLFFKEQHRKLTSCYCHSQVIPKSTLRGSFLLWF